MSGDPRLVRALVACYPAGWRRRYGEEYAQLLCDLHVQRRPALIADSLSGAVRAYGGALMSSRSPMAVVVWAAALFTIAGLGFAKLAEDVTRRPTGSYAVLVAAAAVALLALVAGALPSLVALVRARDAGALRFLAVPVAGAAVWYAILRSTLAIDPPRAAGFLVITVTGAAAVAATAWAAIRVLPARSPIAANVTTAAGMAVATVAAVVWGLRVRSLDPAWFHAGTGILATPFAASWIAVIVALAAATCLAALGSRRPATAH